MRITKGLIIADPWIGYILGGTKDWEMRSSGASLRGWFGLIRKGTGAVYGVARLIEVGAPLSPSEMVATFEHHRIPEHMIRSGEVAKWNTPWKLADVRQFGRPVPYRHKSGAVTWVELDGATIDGVASQFGTAVQTANLEKAKPMAGASHRDQVGSADTLKVDVAQHGRKPDTDVELNDAKTGIATPAPPSLPPALNVARPLTLSVPVPAAPQTSSGRVIGEVEITEGNITHNHIYLRAFFDRFPADAVGGSNKAARANQDLTIEWGGGEPVQTDLDGQKKFFRARGWIGVFYKLNRAEAGDYVVVEETAPYRYRVSLKTSGTGKRS